MSLCAFLPGMACVFDRESEAFVWLPWKTGLMEPGCTRRGLGRGVQPAAPRRPRSQLMVSRFPGEISECRARSAFFCLRVCAVNGRV